MAGRRDLRTVLLRGSLAVAMLAILGTGLLGIVHSLLSYRGEMERHREQGLAECRQRVRADADRAIQLVNGVREHMRHRLEMTLRENVEMAHDLAEALLRRESGRRSPEEAQELVIEALRSLRFRDRRCYYFATTLDGVARLWPSHPQQEGRSLLDVRDEEGRPVVEDMIAVVRRDGAGFHRYRMARAAHARDIAPKLSYVMRFEPFDWYLGAGENLDAFEEDVKAEALRQLENLEVAHVWSFFAGREDGMSLLGPAKGRNVLEEVDQHAAVVMRRLLELARAGGGFVDYEMPRLDGEPRGRKLSYVHGIPEWGWYVGAGQYMDELEEPVRARQAQLRGQMLGQVGGILGIVLVMTLVTMAISRRVARAPKREIDRLRAFVSEAESGPASVDPESFRLEELAELARAGNAMVEARDRAQHEAERRRRRQEVLADIGSRLADATDERLPEEIETTVAAVIRELGVDHCCVWRFSGTDGPAWPVREEGCGQEAALSPFRERLARGEGVIRPDTERLPLDAPEAEAELYRGRGIRALAALPLVRSGETVGSLHAVCRSGPRDWTEDELDWLRAVGRAIEGAMDRRDGHEALVRSEQRLRALVEHAPIPISMIDSSGRVEWLNARFTDTLGYTREDVPDLDAWWRHAFPERTSRDEARRLWDRFLARSLRTEGTLPPTEVVLTRRDGEQRTMEILGAPVGNGLVVVLNDLTDRRRLEEQLRQSQKLESIGQLAGGVAHDFNNQLTGILGYAEALRRRTTSERDRRDLDRIITACSRSAELTAQLLAFARKGQFRREPVDLHRTIDEVVSILSRTIDRRVRVRCDLRAKRAVCTGDPTQLQNLILNLALNARDAMPEGGDLEFRTADRRLESGLRVDATTRLPEGRYVEIQVIDDGVGIEPGVLPHVFEPFFTTKPEGAGTGMGLSAVFGSVHRHGGAIRVESKPGAGSIFTVLLPVAVGERTDDAPANDDAPDSSKLRILVVDDEELVRGSLGAMLEALGHEVVLCGEGARVPDLVGGNKAFDLVLLDLVMPGIHGGEVHARLRERSPDLRVLVMSGHTVDGEAQRLLDEGAVGFLQKPCSMDELRAAVSAAVHA